MAAYKVTIVERIEYTINVEAENKSDADRLAWHKYSLYCLKPSDRDVEITNIEEGE
jgi:hypothetical protein